MPDLIPVPDDVAHVAAMALDTRVKRGGGGTARGVVLATALSTGYVRPTELDEIADWHASHPDDVDGTASTLVGGLYGGAPARVWIPDRPKAAAPAPSSSQLAKLSRTMNRADKTLVAKIHGDANLALKDALRHAGVKLKVRAKNKSRPIAAALDDGVPPTPAMMAAVGVTEQELLDGRFETFGAEAKALFSSAERRKLRAAAQAVGLDPDDTERLYDDEIEQRSEKAAGFLVVALGVLARSALSGSKLEPTGPGEYAGPVPFGVVRTAWSIAATGATAPSTSELGPGPADVDSIAESLARAGQTLVEEILSDALGPLVLTSTWSHGDPDKPFPAHEALDGVSWESGGEYPDALYVAADDAWLEREMYEPGDHDGCTCWIDTEFAPATEGAAAEPMTAAVDYIKGPDGKFEGSRGGGDTIQKSDEAKAKLEALPPASAADKSGGYDKDASGLFAKSVASEDASSQLELIDRPGDPLTASIKLDALTPTQAGVTTSGVQGKLDDPDTRQITVIRDQSTNTNYIVDGMHSAVASALEGDSRVTVNAWHVENLQQETASRGL